MWACLSDRIEDSLSCNGGGRRGGDGHSPDANVGSYSNDHCSVVLFLLYDFFGYRSFRICSSLAEEAASLLLFFLANWIPIYIVNTMMHFCLAAGMDVWSGMSMHTKLFHHGSAVFVVIKQRGNENGGNDPSP